MSPPAKPKAPPKPRVIKPKATPKPAVLSKTQKLIAKADKQANLETFGLANGSKAKFIANFKKLKKLGYTGMSSD